MKPADLGISPFLHDNYNTDNCYSVLEPSLLMPTPLSELKKEKSYFKMLVKRDKDLEMLKKKHEKVRATLNAPITTSRLLFSSAEMFKKPLWQTVWTQIRLLLFASILQLVSRVRQLFAADDFSRSHFSDAFFIGALRVKHILHYGLILSKLNFRVKPAWP